MQQLEGSSSVLEISSSSPSSKAVMAVTAAAATAAAAPPPAEEEVVGMETVDGGNSGEEKMMMSMTSFGGNRWPRQETLTLLKIRSDMDSLFRDSTLKAPLWENVSRKLAELGYHRSAKKCKEKFENVYKYHKRTKDCRSSGSTNGNKSEGGKTYKFFDQLQALEKNKSNNTSIPSQPLFPTTKTLTFSTTTPPPPPTNNNNVTTTTTTIVTNPPNNNNKKKKKVIMNNLLSSSSSPTSTSSSTASDEGLEERYKKKRKYWKDYFRRLTRQVLSKQDDMQKKFLESIDKRERERLAQQDSWRAQEIGRINKEHESMIQERSAAAAKDTAVIALLHKLSGQQKPVPQSEPHTHTQLEIVQRENSGTTTTTTTSTSTTTITTQNQMMMRSCFPSSRWPKAEVHALIRLRTSLDSKYQENGAKAPLWEDISAGMLRLGYNRSSKRCKEKWENINKYFKKVKDSNKQRRGDSKTCPYFNELEALYSHKTNSQNDGVKSSNEMVMMMMMEPLMVQPEQQWRPPSSVLDEGNNGSHQQGQQKQAQELEQQQQQQQQQYDDDGGGDSVEHKDEEEEEGGNRYEFVANKLSSVERDKIIN